MAQYKYVDRNGMESGLLSEGEIQFLYDRGSIHEDSRIFTTDGDRWMSLVEAFPEAPWRRPAPPVTEPPVSVWEAPGAPLAADSSSKGRLTWVDYLIAGGIFLLFMIPNLLSSSPQPKPSSEAEAMGMECGRFTAVFIPSGIYLLFRKWWSRLVAALSCGGLLLVLVCVAIPFTMGFRNARERSLKADRVDYVRVQTAPWVSLEMPGKPAEVPVQSEEMAVERQHNHKVLLRDLMVEVFTVDMAKGFQLHPPGAVQEHRKRLSSSGVPESQISPAKPIEAGGGRGLTMDYWTTRRGDRLSFKYAVLAFPKGAEFPDKGLLLIVGGKKTDSEVAAIFTRILESIEFRPVDKKPAEGSQVRPFRNPFASPKQPHP